MGLARLPVLASGVIFIFLASQTVFGQASTASSPSGSTAAVAQPSQGASTPPKLLGDFVPCVQDPSEDWELLGLQQPTPQSQTLSQERVKALTDSAVAAAQLAGMQITNLKNVMSENEGEYIELPFRAAVARITNDAINTITSDSGTTSAMKTAAINAVKNAFPVSAPTFQRPNDVSCSISILGWKETSDTFGRRIANEYVALQVTVRNLNSKNEFLIHDVQVAVDTGVDTGYFGQFHGGRDKLLIRAVAQRGQFEDRRNLIINALGLVGAVAAVPTGTASSEFSTAVAVFTGQLVPGLANVVFPDHTVQQINNINDLGFSASSTSKMIVPIQGSVPFVTFIAEKPIEQLPFAWCGNKHGKKTVFDPDYPNPPTGWDKDTQLPDKSCIVPSTSPPAQSPVLRNWQYGATLTNLHYRNWAGAALRILQNNTYVVVGGMHIQEANSSPSITNLNCPTIFGGQIDLSQLTNGQFACTVTGSSLASVHSVELQLNSNKVSGTIKPSTDGTSAQILFAATDLASQAGNYELYFLDASGNATDAQNSMLLSEQPVITAQPNMDPTTKVITLTGTNLTKLSAVSLVPSTSGNGVPCTSQTATSSTWTCLPTPALTSGSYSLQYTINGVTSYTATRKDLTVTVQ